jgi:aminoglycoside 6'-N-acetyltransferase I
VGYLEGIWVDERHRSGGIGRDLVAAAERWARAQGCTEMASDRLLENEASGLFHAAVGYDEAERIVCFRKSLTLQEVADMRREP